MQDEFDFTKPHPAFNPDLAPLKPATSRYYDAEVAAALFETSGRPEQFAAGETLFEENEKSG
ncbi:MAG: hypothetical protein ABL931_23790, partial [Usitatibacteraceae bacterium]